MADESPAPYMSFGVFLNTIETLASSTVPTGPLDRRVLDGLSGADYGSLISGLKFLGLVNDNRVATAEYRALVHSTGAEFKAALHDIIERKYKPIVNGLDPATGTAAELERAFKDAGVAQGQMLTKTVRFYVKALQECGVTVSPHITKPKKASSGKRAEPARKSSKVAPNADAGRANPPAGAVHIGPPDGFERMPIPGIPNAHIQYPVNLNEAACLMFESMVGALKIYAKVRSGGREKP